MMRDLVRDLSGGDRRSIGNANAVVRDVLRDPELFAAVVEGLSNNDALVRMRCADVVEKVSRAHPEWLRPYKKRLLGIAASACEQELRWHLAQLMPRLDLDKTERRRMEAILLTYLSDKSRIVRTFAMQALADLAIGDPALLRRVSPLIDRLSRTGSPAVRARARKLIGAIKPS